MMNLNFHSASFRLLTSLIIFLSFTSLASAQQLFKVTGNVCIGSQAVYVFTGSNCSRVVWPDPIGAEKISTDESSITVRFTSSYAEISVNFDCDGIYGGSISTGPLFPSNSITPSVTISADKNNVYEGTAIKFTALPDKGGTNPSYLWKVNNANAPGATNSSTYTTTSLKNGDVVTCVLYSNAPCRTTGSVNSNPIEAVIIPKQDYTVTIDGDDNICGNRTEYSYWATVEDGPPGETLSYEWFIADQPVTSIYSDIPPNVLVVDHINDQNQVKCVVTTTDPAFVTEVTSLPFEVNLIAPGNFSAYIDMGPQGIYLCDGDPVTLTAVPVGDYHVTQFRWYYNTTLLSETGPELTVTPADAEEMNLYSVSLTSNGCVTNTTADADLLNIPFEIVAKPTATINLPAGNTGCGSVTLQAVEQEAGYYYSWKNSSGEVVSSSVSFATTISDTYTLTTTRNSCSTTSAAVSITVNPLPAAPVAAEASNITHTSFQANWQAVTGVSGYELEVASDQDFNNIINTFTNLTETNLSVENLQANTNYYYRVRSISNCNSHNSDLQVLTTRLSIPVVTIEDVQLTGFTVSWNPVSGASTYRVEVAEDNAFTTLYAAFDDLTITSQLLTELTYGNTYYVRVKAFTTDNDSEFSGPENVTLDGICSQPQNLIASTNDNNATLSLDLINAAQRYDFQYRVLGEETWTTATSTSPSLDIANLAPGSSYEWRVITVCHVGQDLKSEPVQGQNFSIAAECLTPATLTANVTGNTTATLSVANDENVVEYRFFYRLAGAGSQAWTRLNSTTASLDVTDLIPGAAYEWQVRNMCYADPEILSESANGTNFTTTGSCAAPSGLVAEVTGETTTTLSIQAAIAANKYLYRYRLSGATDWITVTSTETSIQLNNLIPGASYQWEVSTVCNVTPYYDSPANTGTVFTQQGACSAPATLTTDVTGPSTATLSLSTATAAQVYEYRYRRTGSMNWHTIKSTFPSLEVSGLYPGETYEWEARTVCNAAAPNIQSDFQTPVNFTTENSSTLDDMPSELIIRRDGTYINNDYHDRMNASLDELQVGFENEIVSCEDALVMPVFRIWYQADQNTYQDWQVSLTLSILDDNNNVIWTGDLNLDHTQLEVMNHLFYDRYIDCTLGYKYRIDGKTITAPNGHQAELSGDVFFKLMLYKKQENTFDIHASTTLNFNETQENLKTFRWEALPGAVEYELQLAFIDQRDKDKPGQNDNLEVVFQNWPVTSLRTRLTQAEIPLKYPEGTLYLRIRGWGQGYDQHYPGRWSAIRNLSISDPDKNRNWQMVNSFAEDGRNKKVLTYFDATGRARQVKTYLASQQQTIVAETMYDKEGREVVQVLPAPVDTDNLDFTEASNLFEGPSDETTEDDNTNITNFDNGELANEKMKGVAANYYSHLSATEFPMLPDAAGYVYSHTSFANDNTGRVRRQSGVGQVFTESYAEENHNTQYFYGGTNQAELARIFGNQVGEANHYRKNLVVDPNQQVSVTFLDREGRTVATGLAGDSPHELDALSSNAGEQPINISLNDKNNKTGNVALVNHPITNVKRNTAYNFNYTIDPQVISQCATCFYDLEMYVLDPKGEKVTIQNLQGDAILIEQVITLSNINCNEKVYAPITFSITANQIGDYRVVKQLTLKPLAYDEIMTIAGGLVADEITAAHLEINDNIDIDQFCKPCIEVIDKDIVLNGDDVTICGKQVQEILQEAVQSSADASCENYKTKLIEELFALNSKPFPDLQIEHFYREDRLNKYIAWHRGEQDLDEDMYALDMTSQYLCAYELCLATNESRTFDLVLNLMHANEAEGLYGQQFMGVSQHDPFFEQNPQYLASFIEALHNITFTSYIDPTKCHNENTATITVSIYEIIDENAEALKLNPTCMTPAEEGQNFPHLFFTNNIINNYTTNFKAEYIKNYPPDEDSEIDLSDGAIKKHYRWSLFKGFYEKVKRQILVQYYKDQNCPVLEEDLNRMNLLPDNVKEGNEMANKPDQLNPGYTFFEGEFQTFMEEFIKPCEPAGDNIVSQNLDVDCNCDLLKTCKTIELQEAYDFAIANKNDLINAKYKTCSLRVEAEKTWHKERVAREIKEAKASELWNSYQANCYAAGLEDIKYSTSYQEYHYTLYFYDQGGNLMRTVPPNGVDEFLQSGQYSFMTNYRYNSLNQLTWQETPDAGNSRFYYNDKEQLRLSQNAKQQAASTPEYSYTKYDVHSRISEVGWFASSEPMADLVAKINDPDFPAEADYELKEITRTYYDLPATTIPVAFEQNYLRSRVSYVQVWEDETTLQTSTYYSYDPHGNVESLLQVIPGLEPKRMDYVYDLASGNVNYVMYQYGQPDQLMHRYHYDDDNRITAVATSTDGFVWETDARYKYYPHGPLMQVDLGEDQVQTVDYYYTLQGWLKGINEPLRDPDPLQAKDAFAVVLGYHANDFTPVDNTITLTENRDQLWQAYDALPDNSTGLYNGNIAWMNTHLPGVDPDDATQGNQAMLYRYDQLNRIKAARSLTNYTGSFSSRDNSAKAYDTDYTYDGNGNLLTLQRRDQNAELIAGFDYQYDKGNNQLTRLLAGGTEVKNYDYVPSATEQDHLYKKVSIDNTTIIAGETVTLEATEEIILGGNLVIEPGANFTTELVAEDPDRAPVDEYEYDEIGNLVTDHTRQTEITWTVYGKVKKVTHTGDGGEVTFTYDGAGNRVSKAVTSGGSTTTTHYLRDASGNVMAIYKDTQLAEQPIYGSSRLGQYTGRPAPGKRIWQRKKYELSNHLGNVLAVVGDGYTTTSGNKEAWISSLKDYYPFGLAMEGRSSNLGDYRYGFNGKEQDPASEWGQTSYDYGFRIYNPEIGKFLSVDPLTVEYSMLTPYQFASNRPIDGIDLDGLEFFPSSVFVWEKFEIVYSTSSGKEYPESTVRPTLDYVRFKKRFPNLNFLLRNEGVFLQNNSSPPSNHTQKVIYTHDMELKSYYMAKNYKVKNGERVSTPNTVWKAHKKVLTKTSHIRQGKSPKGLIAADLALMVIEVFMESKKRAASKEARTFNNIELQAVLLTRELINNAYYSKEIPQEIIFDDKNMSELANYILRGDKSINRDINELGKWLFENSYQINNETETMTKNPLKRNDGSWKKGYSTPNPLKNE